MNLFKIPLNLSYSEVLPFLGMDKEPSPQEKRLIEYYTKDINNKAQPEGIWHTFIVKHHAPDKIVLENSSLILEGIGTSQHFKTCNKITLLATTLGQEIDTFLEQLSQNSPAHALIFDGVASAAVEYFTEQLDIFLSREIRRKGYFPTARFSPGYGDWPLNWQKNFVESLGTEKIGLSITPHFLLQPIKSVTAALGWSKIPVERSYSDKTPTKKPCRSSHTCSHCKMAATCPDKMNVS